MADGTMESGFAELLRELKNRSGHSYGTLAKRLHMSTSTLHRYCNGDAVPTDYAPVERFARLCKATPEELVELHRRWVLADAGRGRKDPAAREEAAQEAVPVPVPTSASASASETVAAPEPEPEPAPEAVPVQVPVGGVPEPEAEPAPSVPELEPPVSDVPEPVPDARIRTRRRTRTVLLSALALTAVLGSVALALTLPSGGAEADGKGGPAAAGSGAVGQHAPTAGAAHGTDPSRSPSSSSSPSGTSATGSGASPGDQPSGAARTPTGAAGGTDTAAVPLAVTTHPYSWPSPCSQHYLIDRAPGDVSPPPLEQDAPAWVAVHQAVSAGEQYVTFTVQGTGADTVVLEGLSVRMAGRRAPLAWNDYAMGYPGVGCGGGVPTRAFTVALDALRPQVVPESGQQDFPFKVSRADPEVFHVTADASAYDVSWYLELSWSSGTRHGTLLIGDNGRPLRTSGNNGRPAYAFPLGGNTWKPAAEAN
ncbi:helix-turn-helix domain-containing protein [Streptomyces camelliae]|uniref:Helix-turn-helix transcriptional regulator n=1 Tax=Streptomyces camelliae TaxID=3004093 RepID=A0ABY7P5M7_9ACTN|nr:helix-turn-helix transcriptional regulator [Streptomyces sp. HUAS 2-6]WBO64633.1 helix-turn-helix transcriptional regulator [Streptomyces sp. HUAS 2-6]